MLWMIPRITSHAYIDAAIKRTQLVVDRRGGATNIAKPKLIKENRLNS
jgi:hypothetical protein